MTNALLLNAYSKVLLLRPHNIKYHTILSTTHY